MGEVEKKTYLLNIEKYRFYHSLCMITEIVLIFLKKSSAVVS